MKISVAVITYNQEDTIRQTLDSVLCQKGDFTLEVVIGDDHSTDNNRVICDEYARKYPLGSRVWVKLLPDEPNLGIMRNFTRIIKNCDGDYVAICAGDDFWCDEHKIQKQLDFFNTHPECGVVSTSGYKLLVRKNKMIPNAIAPFHLMEDGDVKSFYFSPSYSGGVYAMPLSLLIRKETLAHVDFDEFARRDFPVEDYPMQAVMSQYCKWGHIPDLTVVYRVYKESATFISYDSPKYLKYHRGLMNIRRYLNELFPNDACFAEESMLEYEFYKEFLLYLYRLEYDKAKKLIESYKDIVSGSGKFRQAENMTRNKMVFFAFSLFKIMKGKIEVIKHT